MSARSFRTLDGMRGVAALCIVVLHSHRYFGDLLPAAQMAVDLFFVLSGFVLAHAYTSRLREGMTPLHFMRLRYARLYPFYLLGIFLGIAQAICMMRYEGQEVMKNHQEDGWTWLQLVTDLPFAVFMLPDPFASALFPLNGLMWSIFFELVANLIWVVFWRRLESTKVLVGVILASGALLTGAAFWWDTTALGGGWSTFLGAFARVMYSFMLGLLLYRFHQSLRAPRIPPILLLGTLPALAAISLNTPAQLFCALVILPVLVLLGAKSEPRGRMAFICAKLGIASYGVYALHKRLYMLSCGVLLQFFDIRAEQYAPWIGLVLLAILVVGCVILAEVFEAPARRWLSLLLARHSAVPGPRAPLTSPEPDPTPRSHNEDGGRRPNAPSSNPDDPIKLTDRA